jgi:predicted O-methyltransferase YrrM
MPLSLSLESRTLEELRKFSDTFVETGTHLGGGVQSALEAGFEVIMSCELDPALFKAARYLVELNPVGREKVRLFLGDSATLLPEMLRMCGKPSVVFLDAHREEAEGITPSFPLELEFRALLSAPRRDHMILVDDVDLCGKPQMAGVTLDDIKGRLMQIFPLYKFSRLWGARHESLLVADPR